MCEIGIFVQMINDMKEVELKYNWNLQRKAYILCISLEINSTLKDEL